MNKNTLMIELENKLQDAHIHIANIDRNIDRQQAQKEIWFGVCGMLESLISTAKKAETEREPKATA